MSDTSEQLEKNYYPITDVINSTGSVENPAPNTQAQVVQNSNEIKTGGASIFDGDVKSRNYVADVAGWLLGIDGIIRAIGVKISGTITAIAGYIGGWVIGATTISSTNNKVILDSSNEKITVGTITIDGVNDRIRSGNYSAGVSGFTIEPSIIEAENFVARATLKGATFQYNVVSAVGGQLIVANADTLATDMTALDASTLTTKGNTTFAVNDIILIQAITALGIQTEYLRITNIGSAPTYSVTRDLASAYSSNVNPIWKAGTTITKIGSSDGSSTYSGGWLRLIGEGTNAPYYSVFKRTGLAYSDYTEYCRLGNLNGFLGYSSNEFGIAIGETNKFLKYDPTNGLRISGQSNVSEIFTAGRAISQGNCVIIGNGTDSYKEASQETNDGTAYSAADATWIAQTFKTSNRAVTIKSVTVHGNRGGGLGTNTYIRIRATSGGVPTGADLASKQFTGGVSEADQTITLTTPLAVSANTTYALIVSCDSDGYNWFRKDSDVYADGQACTSSDSGANWSAVSTKDLHFYITEIETEAGKIYKATALQAGDLVNNFLGFAVANISAGSDGAVNISGVENNQTGLTVGVPYYISDTEGAISTSAGSVSKKVGLSTSDTKLLILNS